MSIYFTTQYESHVLDRISHGIAYPHCIDSTVPPSEDGVLNHPQLIPKEHKLAFFQGLGEDVHNLVIYGNVLELHNPPLNIFPNEVVPNLNVLGLVTKHSIL